MATTESPKHLEVYSRLRDDIDAGAYRPGRRIPTESELCQRFKVSRPTIARAIGILEQQGRLIRRRGAGTFVADIPTKSKQFGLLIPDLHAGGIFASLCAAVTDNAAAAGHNVVFAGKFSRTRYGDADEIDRCAQQLVDAGVSGVFFSPLELAAPSNVNARIVQRFADANIPVVLLDRDITPYPERSHLDLAGIDNYRAGFTVTHHAVSLGCRRIAFVAAGAPTSAICGRMDGYRSALWRAGITPDPAWVRWGLVHEIPHFVEQIMQEVRADALICINDHMARDILLRLALLNVAVPGDVRIISFDDLHFAATLPVPLTTLHQPLDDIGAAAVELMLQRIENPNRPVRDVNMRCELIVRESCGGKG